MADETAGAGRGGGERPLVLPDEVRAEARAQPEWEADIIALPATVAESDRSYQTATLVCAGPVVVAVEQGAGGGAEPEQVAERIEAALARAAEAVGEWPEAVAVRHPEVARALTDRFERGIGPLGRGDRPEVTAMFYLDYLNDAARALVEHLTGEDAWPPIAVIQTWVAWGLPDAEVETLFAAASAYWRAAPWEVLDDAPPLTASWPDGEEWTLSVLGAGAAERGLAVYADEEDYDATLRAMSPEEAFGDPGNWILSLAYAAQPELPRPMRREIARAGWNVASPEAYPLVFPIFTPGGGLPRRIARRLAEVLAGVALLVESSRERIEHGEPTHVAAPGGIELDYPGEDADERDARDPYDGLPPELHELVDDVRAGKFAPPEEADAAFEARVEAFNATPRAELSGLSPVQAHALLEGEWNATGPLRLADDLSLDDLAGADFLHNARALLAAANAADGAPATDAGNLKRAFVADMLERLRWPEGELEMVRLHNKVINEGDVPRLHRLRVVLDVAGLIQRRKARFRVTRKGRELLDDDAAGRLMAHLFRTYFRDFNIGYGGRGTETETLQHVVPLILARLPREASGWIDRDVLAGVLMPPEPPRSPPDPGGARLFDSREIRRIQLAVHVLDPLARFGLLDERGAGGGARRMFGGVEVRVAELFERFVRVEWE